MAGLVSPYDHCNTVTELPAGHCRTLNSNSGRTRVCCMYGGRYACMYAGMYLIPTMTPLKEFLSLSHCADGKGEPGEVHDLCKGHS